MSINFSVYVGAYIELYEREYAIKRTKEKCCVCGTEYSLGEAFCSVAFETE